MIKLNFKALALAAAMLGTTLAALAVPAKPGILQYTQPDGSVINVRLMGDEFHHYYMSEDEYLIVQATDGLFYFAEATEADEIIPSAYRVTNIDERDASVSSFLATIDRESILQTMALTDETTRSIMRAASGMGTMSKLSFPREGDRNVLVILVDFPDMKYTLSDPKDYFTRMLNEDGFNEYTANGSAREYFISSSNGIFRPTFDVVGPVTVEKSYAYYGEDSGSSHNVNVREMIVEAATLVDDEVDFAKYDTDGDNVIDCVYVFYAGRGQAEGGGVETIWPHSSNVGGSYYFDNKRLYNYTTSNEWSGTASSGKPKGMGTLVHEFSHALGLPDHYATLSPTPAPFLPGAWDVMSTGCYNNNSFSPALYSAHERWSFGWIEPIEITGELNAKLLPLCESNQAYLIRTQTSTEYYMLENRQQRSFDRYLPGHGMLVWHIDYNKSLFDRNQVNNNASHQYVDIVEADNILTDATRAGDAFPGTANITEFTPETTPALKSWAGNAINLPITEITENAPDGTITFYVKGGKFMDGSPVANAAKNVAARSFTASWSTMPDATSYRLWVYIDNGDDVYFVPGFNNRKVKGTSIEVTGLEPGTKYLYYLVGESETATSGPSNEVAVTTLPYTHSCAIPTALEADGITNTAFTANWEAFEGADSYLINAYSRQLRGATTKTEEFTGSFSNWLTNASTFYSSKNFCGKATPSLKLLDGNYVSSPATEGAVHSFSFWARGSKTVATSRIAVEALIGECWVPVAYFNINTALHSADVFNSVNSFPEGTEAVRLVFEEPDVAAALVYVDDLKVVYGGTKQTSPFATDLAVGNVTSHTFNNCAEGTEYLYSIKAVKGGVSSLPSAEKYVLTLGESGIESIAADGSASVIVDGRNISAGADVKTMQIYDASGAMLYSGCAGTLIAPAAGVYIVVTDGTASKVLVK